MSKEKTEQSIDQFKVKGGASEVNNEKTEEIKEYYWPLKIRDYMRI